MDSNSRPQLVSAHWLEQHLDDASVVVLDASFHLPTSGRDAAAEYRETHIPRAVFFDIDAISDADNALPHMLPSESVFSAACQALGINQNSTVVVYDTVGLFSAARAWWMLEVFGHQRVAVLDGGLPRWQRDGRAVDNTEVTPDRGDFVATLDATRVRNLDQLLANLDQAHEQVVDARAAGRFNGTEPEPRPGMRSGHIPGAVNVPVSSLLDGATGLVHANQVLEQLFVDAGAKLDKPVITSCGSGVTACALTLALSLIGKRDVSVYDGSWSEWGARPDTPIDC